MEITMEYVRLARILGFVQILKINLETSARP